MENIKKMMISLDDTNKIRKIVVVGNYVIKRYTNESLSDRELRNIYSECVKTLKEENESDLVRLTEQAKV